MKKTAYDGSIKFDTKIDSTGLEKGLKKAGAAVTAALGAAAAAAVKVGSDFEAAMSSVTAISRASAEEAEMMKNAAIEAGEATKFSATESANALEYLSLAGYSAQESVEALPKVLNLAAAGGMDLAYASDLLTDSMAVLGLGIENMDNFSDQLAMAASKSNTSVAQLGEAVLVAGGQAKLCGMEVTEMNTALGILADKGIKGSEGGTALRNTLKNLYTPTEASAKAMKKLGLETADAEGNLRPMQDVLKDLNSILGEMTEADKTNAMADIFDTRTIAAATALLDSCGDRWDELEGYLSDCDGAAKEMADTMNDNLQGKLKLCASAAESVGIAVYDSIKEPLKDAADAGAEALSKLAKKIRDGEGIIGGLIKNIDTLAITAAACVVAFKGYAILQTVTTWYKNTMVAVNAYTAAIAANKAMETRGITIDLLLASTMKAKEILLAALTGKMTLHTAATTLATKAQTAFNAAMTANPAGVVLVAVAALAAGVVLLTKVLGKETEAEKKARKEREAFAEKTDELAQKTEELKSAQESLKDSYQDSLNDAAAEAAVAEELRDRLGELIEKETHTLSEKKEIAAIVAELNKILPDLNWIYDEEADKLTDVNGEMVTYIDRLDEYIEAKKKQADAEAALELYKEEIKERIKLGQQEKDLQEQLADAEKKRADAQEKLSDMEAEGTASKGEFKALQEDIKGYEEEIEKLKANLAECTQAADEAARGQENAWSYYLEAIGGAVEGTKSNVDDIKTAFEELDNVPQTTDGVREALQGIYDKMSESGEYSEAFKLAFKEALTLSESDFTLLDDIDTFKAKVSELMGAVAADSMKGYAKGVNDNENLPVEATEDATEATVEAAKDKLDSHSPSKVFEEIGRDIDAGLALGITNNAAAPTGAMRSLVLKLIEAAKKAAEIKSPSHVFRDEVGAMIAKGVTVGIEENSKEATKAYKKLSDSLKTQADMDLIGQEEYYQELESARNKYLKTGTKEWLDATEDLYSGIKKLEESAEKEKQKALEEAAKAERNTLDYYYEIGEISEADYYRGLESIRDRYFADDIDSWREYTKKLIKYEKEKLERVKDEIRDAYEEAFEGVAEKRNDMADKIKDIGVLYSSGTVEIAGEEVKVGSLANIKAQNEYLEKYRDLILGVKERLKGLDISGEDMKAFFNELAQMDIEDGSDFANLLMNVTDSNFKGYIDDWIKKRELSEEIADAVYGEEVQEAASEFEEELSGILDKTGKEIPETFFNIGAEAAEKFGAPFCSGISEVLERAQGAIDDFFTSSQLTALVEAAGGGGAVYREAAGDRDTVYREAVQEASEFEEELSAILERAGAEIPDTFFDIGAEAAEKFGEQFCIGISDVLKKAQGMITGFFSASGLTGLSGAGTNSYSSTYNFYSSGQSVSEQLRSAQNAAAMERARYA